MIVEQTLFGTVFLSNGNKVTVSPQLRGSEKGGCTVKVENNGYEHSFSLSKEGLREFKDILQKYTEQD